MYFNNINFKLFYVAVVVVKINNLLMLQMVLTVLINGVDDNNITKILNIIMNLMTL